VGDVKRILQTSTTAIQKLPNSHGGRFRTNCAAYDGTDAIGVGRFFHRVTGIYVRWRILLRAGVCG
jgi:hypothetical protein